MDYPVSCGCAVKHMADRYRRMVHVGVKWSCNECGQPILPVGRTPEQAVARGREIARLQADFLAVMAEYGPDSREADRAQARLVDYKRRG